MSCGMDFSNFPLYDSQICPLLLFSNDIARARGIYFGCIIILLQSLKWFQFYNIGMKDDVLLKLAQNLEYFMSHGKKK